MKRLKSGIKGRLGSLVGQVPDFGSGHDLMIRGFEPHIRLCADSSEPGAFFGFCCLPLSLPLPPPLVHTCALAHALSLSLSLSKINKH